MPATSVTSRSAPPRRFENYIFTKIVDPSAGLTNIPDSLFTLAPGALGAALTDDAFNSTPLPIGFDFSFDGIVYKNWAVDTNGWMCLTDPANATFDPSEVLSSNEWKNESIRDKFTSNSVLLAPWFDDLRNLAGTVNDLNSFGGYGVDKLNHITFGLETPPPVLNFVAYSIRYYHDSRSPRGRRFIMRWTSLSNINFADATSVITFEVVIYETGTIEFRYGSRSSILAVQSSDPTHRHEAATIGIFMPGGSGVGGDPNQYRFRDFAIGLGYRDEARQQYTYGAFQYSTSYTDNLPSGAEGAPASAPYTISLTPFMNWPGLSNSGCIMRFSPPVSRRKVLPRTEVKRRGDRNTLPLVARVGDTRTGRGLTGFDDRKSPNYTSSGSVLVNYPTTLQRFFGGSAVGTFERQDLFSGDFDVTGSVVKSAIDQYVNDGPQGRVEPFSETTMYEQSADSDPFFASGSNPTFVGAGFDQALKSKTHVKMSLPVNYRTFMPAATSSIYYYNAKSRVWEVPALSSYIISTTDSTPPVPNPGAGGDWADPTKFTLNSLVTEDARGFGAMGNIVSSGSHTPTANGDQTDAAIGAPYTAANMSTTIGKSYSKSVRNNEEYRAVPDETFMAPISVPLLIEKAVFEVPLAMGPGWFQDQTQCFLPLGGHSFDMAGPALTVALYRQVQLSENSPGPTRRDLILTGTIIPSGDNVSSIVLSNFPSIDSTFQLRPVGFAAYGGKPGAIVTSDASQMFTGSVTVHGTALSAVGPQISYVSLFTSGSAAVNRLGISNLLNLNTTLSLVTNTSQSVNVLSVSPFGRGGSGFQQAGRSVLGNEYVTTQGLSDPSGLSAPNPFYLNGATVPPQIAATLAGGGAFSAKAITTVSLVSHFPSPYLLYPGDKLVLSISKMRPYVYAGSGSVPTFSGTLQHDVQMMSGNINITLYGSQVQEGVEFHDTLNQELGSDNVHEIIGAEPVLDQFNVPYRNELSGSFTDNVMIGSLGTVTINGVVTQTVRDRRLSRLNARNVAQLTTSSADIMITPSKAYRKQPWFEQVGDVRHSQHVDSSERFWDSMMPSVTDCFKADGSGIFITTFSALGNPAQVDVGVSSSSGIDPNPIRTRLGWMWMDYQQPTLIAAGYGPLINSNWTKAYPFEPRYQAASRQLDVSKTFLATYFYNPFGSPVVSAIEPREVNGFVFGPVKQGTVVTSHRLDIFEAWVYFTSYFPNSIVSTWVSDANLAASGSILVDSSPNAGFNHPYGYYTTGSAGINDISRALFGFGDNRTYFQYNDSGNLTLLGAGHFANSRDLEGPHPDGVYARDLDASEFVFSPVIRGWKYGVYSGIPTFSKCYWRPGRFGQHRDMLEQRLYTKYYQVPTTTALNDGAAIQGAQPAAVTVNFVDANGKLTPPDNTWSSNLSLECTASVPFFDGVSMNRPPINAKVLNQNILSFTQDSFGSVTL